MADYTEKDKLDNLVGRIRTLLEDLRRNMTQAEDRKKDYSVDVVEHMDDENKENLMEAIGEYNKWKGREQAMREAQSAVFNVLENFRHWVKQQGS